MKTSSKILTLLAACLSMAAAARATSPAVQSVSASSVTIGESTVLHAEVSDADADLAYVAFYVSGPGISGELHVGDLNVSGSSAKADLPWKPNQIGTYTVRLEVADGSTPGTVSSQNTFEVFTGKLIISPVTIASGVNRIHQYTGEILTTEDTTSAKVVVQSGGNFILWSGGRVTLKPGFHAQAGSFFWAAVDHDMNGYSDLEEVTDVDGNGIPDAWEVDHFGRIGIDSSADPDGDGLTNLQEFQMGCDPKKPDNPDVGLVVYSPAR